MSQCFILQFATNLILRAVVKYFVQQINRHKKKNCNFKIRQLSPATDTLTVRV